MASLKKLARLGLVNDNEEFQVANEYRDRHEHQGAGCAWCQTGKLSGGNQQKVVLSKWINSDPDVLILDEPTRGIDVGAKYEIYTIINRLAAEGKAIIVISSELPELLGICDRIYALSEGRITGELPIDEGHPRSTHQAHDHGEAALIVATGATMSNRHRPRPSTVGQPSTRPEPVHPRVSARRQRPGQERHLHRAGRGGRCCSRS